MKQGTLFYDEKSEGIISITLTGTVTGAITAASTAGRSSSSG